MRKQLLITQIDRKKILEKQFHLNAIFLKNHICHLSTHKQSHYREVAQGGVSSRAIDCKNFANFFPKTQKRNYKRDIMQLFSADATIFLKMPLFCPQKQEKTLLKSCS